MGRQLERGTQFPLRPITATYDMAADDTLDLDTTPDWAHATLGRLTPTLDQKFMDDQTEWTLATSEITLPPGLYKATINLMVTNAHTTETRTFQCKLTDDLGTTDHIVIPATEIGPTIAEEPTVVTINRVGLINLTATDQVVLRAYQTSDADTVLVVASDQILILEKIGNEREN